MATTETLLITVACDIPGCGNTIACGNSFTYAEENGWHLTVPIDDSHKDLCPSCYGDLKAFVEGNDDDESDIMDLKEVLAGEQPRPEDAAND
ncbi:hypothetical protein HWB99_gp074 [Mycobacterium phage DrLupo]|uniref:Uncharacterized protein n=1 Tax=Mycobacterium phage DrLupo TaxID=2499037 RepID=A0A3S9UQP1_9CAUD|nr:hypothetical protein HWB99_gp074 [Mycobacterium phage DrLupo]AZS12610.1 hypothetical protein SEA_DRLUPO_74 [Mycobacterium phage DrLupo]